MKYFVVVPTYNEKENIENLIKEVKKVFSQNSIQGGLIVVDDNSPDKTYEIVEALKSQVSDNNFQLELIHRAGKMGLGSAYLEGFRKALDLGADFVQEMDADFSHKPQYLADFYREIQNYDVVIGSRYVAGGGVENWSPVRKIISRGGSIYAGIILGWRLKDSTAGFVCYRRNVLESIPLDQVKSNGYVFQIEMKYRAYKLGFKMKEIPIIFPDRVVGKSKMSGKIVYEALYKVFALRWMRI
jgi:dolichol-phosphate mannosyltransferase